MDKAFVRHAQTRFRMHTYLLCFSSAEASAAAHSIHQAYVCHHTEGSSWSDLITGVHAHFPEARFVILNLP